MRVRHFLIFLSCLMLAASCSEVGVVSSRFCSKYAKFSVDNVISISQLYSACQSPGEWCTITAENDRYIFANLKGRTPINKVALGAYTGFYLGIGGFIVGLPNTNEPGYDTPMVTCYDLACSNCEKESGYLSIRLEMREFGFAACPKCKRSYNLNNTGTISAGEPGISLYRYRVYYSPERYGGTLSVDNGYR
ncbi:MAG: hypothetical protein KBT12_03955 [Bacteroidales bacterium]|nr:hypothetical protein [Candidatus Physcousia equi]